MMFKTNLSLFYSSTKSTHVNIINKFISVSAFIAQQLLTYNN